MNKALLAFFVGSVIACMLTPAHAGSAPLTGTIISENSVDCGTKGSKKHENDLVCQEYVVRTTTTEYHVRQPKQKDQALLPLNAPIEYVINKDKMNLKVNGKKYEFLVVSEAAITPAAK